MTTVVRAPADLTVVNAAEVRATLLETLDGAEDVVLDLSAVEDLDTAGLQLLLLAGREARSRGVALRCEHPSDVVLQTVQLVGLAASVVAEEHR